MKKTTAHKLSTIAALFVIFLCSVTWLVLSLSLTNKKSIAAASGSNDRKPVIVLLYDSLMDEPMQQAIKAGHAPAFNFLSKQGRYYPEVISSYPTMSVSIDSTILTGTYADKHHIPGLIWFDEQNQQIVSYGSGPHEIWDNGIKEVLVNSTLKLNQEHLHKNAATLYERLYENGLQSASINGLIYRGNTSHQLQVPGLLTRLKLLPKEINTNGPELLALGVLSQYNKGNDRNNFLWDRLGFNNSFTVHELSYLIQNDRLPAFTLSYLPDADADVHKNGPQDIEAIKHADKALQQLLSQFGTWEQALEKAIWVVLGDSGQSLVGENKKESLIAIDELLSSYTLWSRKQQNGQLALALNERMGYIHVRDHNLSLDELVQLLKKDKRIGFIAWHNDNTNYVISPQHEQPLLFSPGGSYRDQYDQTWEIEGDLSLLDLSVSNQLLYYDNYPDALARLHGALHAQEGRFLIIDAKPGYEFSEHHSYNHAGGGSHGSLHKLDSHVPLIAAGTDITLNDTRLVALQQWLLSLVLNQK